jgi:hypothetical protein
MNCPPEVVGVAAAAAAEEDGAGLSWDRECRCWATAVRYWASRFASISSKR